MSVVALQASVVLTHQVINSRSRPESRKNVVFGLRFRQINRNLTHEISARHLALQTNNAMTRARVATCQDNWLCAEEIGNSFRIDICDCETSPINRDVR